MVSSFTRRGQLDGLVDRHLLGGAHGHQARWFCGSERISSSQSVWDRIRPTLTRLLMAWGAASWPMMWPEAGASTTTRS